MGDKDIYYHYINRKGLKGILDSRKICKSTTGKYGKGVYLTKLPPEEWRKKVSKNNWDGNAQAARDDGKVNYTISVSLPKRQVEKHHGIYVFRQDVDLCRTTYKLYSKHGRHEELDNGVLAILNKLALAMNN